MLDLSNNTAINNQNKALMILHLYLEKIYFLQKRLSNCKPTNSNDLKSKLLIEGNLKQLEMSFLSIINGKNNGNDLVVLINYTNEMYDNLKKDLNF